MPADSLLVGLEMISNSLNLCISRLDLETVLPNTTILQQELYFLSLVHWVYYETEGFDSH